MSDALAAGPSDRGCAAVAALLVLSACGDAAVGPDALGADASAAIDATPPIDAAPPVRREWGTPMSEVARWIDVDGAGARYVVGTTTGVFPGQVGAGASDVFVSKLDAGGQVLWTRQWGTAERDEGRVVFVDGDRLLVVWERDDQLGAAHEVRLRRLAAPDGAMIDERVLVAPPTASVRSALLEAGVLTLVGATHTDEDLHTSARPWLARYEVDGAPAGSWTAEWVTGCPSTALIAVVRTGDGLLAASEGLEHGPRCDLGQLVRLSLPSLRLARAEAGDGGLGVLAVGDALYVARGALAIPFRTTVRREGGWERDLGLDGRYRLGRGDAPVAYSSGADDLVVELDPDGGPGRWVDADGSIVDVLAVGGHTLAVGARSGDAYVLDVP